MRGTYLRRSILVLATTLAVPCANAGEALPPAQFADPQRAEKLARAFPELERIAQRWREERRAPGLAWGIVIDGALASSGSAGFRDLERKLPVDADTVFRIASMTKSFTALAILMLRDEGKLELDAPVARYVPELASLAPSTRDSGPITVRHLLTHTAGFPEDNAWGDRQLAIPDAEMSRWLAAGIPFSTATASAYEYSNYGFAILGRVIANVARMQYTDFMNQRVLAPLGMTSSFWDANDVQPSRLAVGYRDEDGKQLRETPLGHGAFGPMGGLFTSSRDLARWVAWMLAAYPPRDDPERPPALRRSVREMQQGAGFPQLSAHRSAGAPMEASAGVYAFGLRTARTCALGTQSGHSGGLPGFGSNMIWLPEYGVGLFAMSNLTYASPGAMLRRMLDALALTGGLAPRRPEPSPALREIGHRVAHLVDDWDDGLARELAADNLFLDESLARRRAAIAALRAALGSCETEPMEAENALRGRFRMQCERGWLDVNLTLAPTRPPRVQSIGVTSGRPLTPGMHAAVEAVLDAMARGSRSLELATGTSRDAVGALLTATREQYGQCRLDSPQEGDGDKRARVRLDCDRGPLELSIARHDGKIESMELEPPFTVSCTP
jgi:CubicO group peptidase (beta-lactamase class C family)